MITFLDILSTNPEYDYIANNEELKRNLSQNDIQLFNQYTKYLSQDPNLPLTQIFPELQNPEYQAYSTLPTHDIIQQYIAEQANNKISLKLNQLSQQVRQEGLTQQVLDQITSIQQSQTVQDTYTPIDFQQQYDQKKDTTRYKDKYQSNR